MRNEEIALRHAGLADFAQTEALLNEYELVGKLNKEHYLVRRDGK